MVHHVLCNVLNASSNLLIVEYVLYSMYCTILQVVFNMNAQCCHTLTWFDLMVPMYEKL